MHKHVGKFNPEERMLHKHEARMADEFLLAKGLVSREFLRKQNGFFSCLDLSRAQIEIRSRRSSR